MTAWLQFKRLASCNTWVRGRPEQPTIPPCLLLQWFSAGLLHPLPTPAGPWVSSEPPTRCKRSSIIIWATPAKSLTGTYQFALRPRIRVAVVIPSRCMESSACRSLADALACASRAAWNQSPVLVCAAIARALPSGVLGPELPRPPWNWHFWVLLTFRAGRPHWSLVVLDFVVHRAHTMRPPAAARRLV
jgi:hypothetical protein